MKKIPSASVEATLKSTSPTFAYFQTAIMPTGNSIAARDVPTALEVENFKNAMSIGTMMIPPPIPNKPARTPAIEPTRSPISSEDARDKFNPVLVKPQSYLQFLESCSKRSPTWLSSPVDGQPYVISQVRLSLNRSYRSHGACH